MGPQASDYRDLAARGRNTSYTYTNGDVRRDQGDRSSSRSDVNVGAGPSRSRVAVQPDTVLAEGLRQPRRDARARYQGYPFVFATDSDHDGIRVHNAGIANSVTYIQPLARQTSMDSRPSVSPPYFFTGFVWTDDHGQTHLTSRVEVCYAWQVAFNRLLYYGSFTEEAGSRLEAEEVQGCKDQFNSWDDLFTELDEALGRISACEQTSFIPHFTNAQPVSSLSNPFNRTTISTPLENLSATFLAAATEIVSRDDRETRAPLAENIRLEEKLRPWEPCMGHAVVHATAWTADRVWTGGMADVHIPEPE